MSQEQNIGYVHSLESFGSVDGPGCPLHYFSKRLCHAMPVLPQSRYLGENAGTPATAEELLDKAWRYRSYWGEKGGITVSGGEPLLQIDFLNELFQKAKERGIHTALDTSGNPVTEQEPYFSKWKELMKNTDLVLLDIKHIDEEQHRILTGQSNRNILRMAQLLSEMKKPMWIRHVLVPERNDKDEYLFRLAEFIRELQSVERVEVLPYHTMGIFKWENLGLDYPLEGVCPPSAERVANAKRILEDCITMKK